MTDGHPHRHIMVPTWDVWYVRLLRHPVWHRPIHLDKQVDKVDASPYPYGQCERARSCVVLTPLGILHRWTGLTLEVKG